MTISTTKGGGATGLLRLAALLATTAAPFALAAPAQAQQNQASLRGTITSTAENPVTAVTAVEINTGYRRNATIDAAGTYNFPSLRPGTYRLELTLATGTRNTDPITLSVGQNAGLDIDLTTTASATGAATAAPPETGAQEPMSGSQAGDIVITANSIKTMQGGEVGAVISQRLIQQLPQNNRNFLAFADLAPGVQFVQGANGDSRIQGGAQDSRSVNIFIDGIGQKDYVLKNGITGQDSSQGNPFPQLAVGEYRVISSNYKAEFDQVSSVAITAVTKSGTNQFHGEAFVDYTDQSLRDARPTELFGTAPGKVKTRDFQFGGALGGPIIKDKMHFFVTYEGKRQQQPVDIQPGNGTTVSSLPSQYQSIFGNTNRTFNEDLYFGKIDIVPTDRDLIEISGKYRKEDSVALNSGSNALSTATNTKFNEKRGTLRWQHTGDSFVNDMNLSYEDIRWAPSPQVFADGKQFRAYVQNPGSNSVSSFDLFRTGGGTNYQDKGQKGYTIQDDFTYTGLEGHTIKAGIKTKFIKLTSLQQNNLNPVYYYNVNLNGQNSFNDTIPYRVVFGAATGNGDSVVTSNNFQLGLYVQDDWDVSDRLTLNLGIRWDYERTPSFLDFKTPADAIAAVSPANYPNLVNANYDINDYITDGTKRKAFTGAFQPRLGFSYKIDDAGRFVLFGGYGRSYDRNQFDFLQQEISVGSFTTRTFNFNTGDPNNVCTPSATCVTFNPTYLTADGRAALAASSAGGGRELRFVKNDLKVPYSDQFSLGMRSRFGNLGAEVGYSHIESRDGFVFLLGNRRPDGAFFNSTPGATETPSSPFGFAPAGYGSIILGENGLKTSADSGYLKLTKSYTRSSPWSLDATYTYTEATENRQFGETFSLDYASINDYPVLRSSGVPKHRIVMAASTDTPIGLTLSAKLTMQSPIYVKSFINTASPYARTIVGTEVMGLGDQWGKRQLDFAFTKYVPFSFISDEARIRVRVDIINVMNDRNYVDYNSNPLDTTRTAGSPTVYRERVGYGVGGNPPRTIKLSAGFSF